MGQIYIPKKVDQNRMWWEGIIPQETHIPPHSHSTQGEFLYLTEGELDMLLDGEEQHAVPGEIIPFRGIRTLITILFISVSTVTRN